jgi:hypothetical protein
MSSSKRNINCPGIAQILELEALSLESINRTPNSPYRLHFALSFPTSQILKKPQVYDNTNYKQINREERQAQQQCCN